MQTNRRSRIQTASVVVILFIIGTLLNIPFSRELKRLKIEAGDTSVALSDSIATDLVQTGIYGLVLGVVLVLIGLWLAKSAQLGAPVIENIFSDTTDIKYQGFFKKLLFPIGLSVVLALVLLMAYKVTRAYFPVEIIIERPSKPFYAIVSFSAGVTEEIMFRFGLMSLVVALIQFFRKAKTPSISVVWTGIIVSAVFFGLIHLPLSKSFSGLSLVTVSSTMIGNLITGSFFGWVYWKRGLLAAIIVHVVWDLVFHVVGSPYM